MPQPHGETSPQADQLPPTADRVVISVNPKSGARSPLDRAKRLGELLEAEGLRAEVLSNLDEVGEMANDHHRRGCLRALVACGGDGTVAELANRTEPGSPLTILPAGNENLLARYLKLGQSPEELCRTIVGGKLRLLDAGRAAGRVFLVMVGCGFDAEVVRCLHEHRSGQHRSGHVRNLSYVKPIFQTIRSYKYPEMQVYCDDEQTPAVRARWVFAFNLPCYAGGLQLAPDASGSDGLLDVCSFEGGSMWHGLRYLAAVLRRKHQGLGDCSTRRARRLRITSDAEVPYQLDGDPGGMLPVDIEILPGRLTMVVPSGEK